MLTSPSDFPIEHGGSFPLNRAIFHRRSPPTRTASAPGAAGRHQVIHQATPGGLGLSRQLLISKPSHGPDMGIVHSYVTCVSLPKGSIHMILVNIYVYIHIYIYIHICYVYIHMCYMYMYIDNTTI